MAPGKNTFMTMRSWESEFVASGQLNLFVTPFDSSFKISQHHFHQSKAYDYYPHVKPVSLSMHQNLLKIHRPNQQTTSY